MNTLTPGRTDSATYSDDHSGQSLADEQRLADLAAEMCGEAFDKQAAGVRDWLFDSVGDCDSPCGRFFLAALFESDADASVAREHLRDLYIGEYCDDFLDDAAEALAAEDADAAADFKDARVES